jgi:hypothetical protein
VRAVGGPGYVKVLGTSCASRSCNLTFRDGRSVMVQAVGRLLRWSGRCHGRNPRCQFDAGLNPFPPAQPWVWARFG